MLNKNKSTAVFTLSTNVIYLRNFFFVLLLFHYNNAQKKVFLLHFMWRETKKHTQIRANVHTVTVFGFGCVCVFAILHMWLSHFPFRSHVHTLPKEQTASLSLSSSMLLSSKWIVHILEHSLHTDPNAHTHTHTKTLNYSLSNFPCTYISSNSFYYFACQTVVLLHHHIV